VPRLFVSKNASARKAFGVPIISIRAGHEAAARESMTGRAHCLYPGWAGHETAARESMTGRAHCRYLDRADD